MKKINKILDSEFLNDEAKQIYIDEHKRFLLNKIDEKNEVINNALKNIDVNFKFILVWD